MTQTIAHPPPILVGVDFSADARRAAERGARLAAEAGTGFVLLHVLPRGALEALRGWLQPQADAVEAALRRDADAQLDAWVAELSAAGGAPGRAELRVGQARGELLAATAGAALLVLGAHGTSPLRDALLGTTAERLLATARVPVLVVRRGADGPYRRVVVPVDLSPASEPALQLARQVAPQASIGVVHAIESPFEGKLRVAGVPDAQIAAHRALVRRRALDAIVALEGRAAVTAARRPALVVDADPALAVLEAARDSGADLIVMGRCEPSAVADLVLGSVTRHVLADAACDVLVLPV
jgi:nucleotide-binding universal stress UspA family protein